MNHKHCWLNFCRPRQAAVLPTRRDLQRWITIQSQRWWPLHMRGEAAKSVVWFSICCWMAYSYYIRCCSEEGICSDMRSLLIVFQATMTSHSYVDSNLKTDVMPMLWSCQVPFVIKTTLVQTPCNSPNVVFKDMTCSHRSQLTRPLASRESLWRNRKATAAILEYQKINYQAVKMKAWSITGGNKWQYWLDAMPCFDLFSCQRCFFTYWFITFFMH